MDNPLHYLPELTVWSKFRSVADWVGIAAAPLGIMRDEEGNVRWNTVIGSVIAGGFLVTAGSLVAMSNEQARLTARQELVLQRLDKLEAQLGVISNETARIVARAELTLLRLESLETNIAPATAKRFTSDDAREMEQRVIKRIERLEQRKGM